ncbi:MULTISPECIES: Xaa-Pro peptidase family protein [unclassified Lactococcus]|uniref:M24 family metallopeptidase n=1 Tax=Lactococcus TaxID=1357 RepID=UPI001431CF35|nr:MULTISPECIES: aminopeptidase P family protein [unclassified Lactococcus]KAF6608257.1 M24 family metallopeptidase [Lactococcus sp. EKM201L]KAF6612109.1 M24 family metallopeptidase [Lactococcus sp. EKM203L]KAF6640565.1 M24 family metallopeptidase [Lactococcus sp. EKM501L]KAF6643485.1 M24 family metallopeptidase [Lactococcus sp. EKM502L]KAF6651326.1 M24 family metallopeptidase [Lactococcus sp. EKM101L]
MNKEIIYEKINEPKLFNNVPPVTLTDKTLKDRKEKLLTIMAKEQYDALIIYADKEHGSNFEYFTGFIPRFEEGLIIIDKNDKATLVLGNENLKMSKHSRIEANLIHSPQFSLPNQPMDNEKSLTQIFKELELYKNKKIGLIGWKMFTTQNEEPSELFDLPYFIVDAVKNSLSTDTILTNAAQLLIGTKGIRTINNANELAHYEYGANLASRCILNAMNQLKIGMKESEIGAILSDEGQAHSVITIAAAGERFKKANFYPSYKEINFGEPISMTTGFKGGLSSRTGFLVNEEKDLQDNQKHYLTDLVIPYYKGVVSWLENISIGMLGNDFYKMIDKNLPKAKYNWHLNPGHYVADEEWMASPFYKNSKVKIASGMIFQIDIIPSVEGLAGVSAEECVAIADQSLKNELKNEYPELWQRIITRRNYLINELNINLSPDVLPLSNTVGYLRPFLLEKSKALKVK